MVASDLVIFLRISVSRVRLTLGAYHNFFFGGGYIWSPIHDLEGPVPPSRPQHGIATDKGKVCHNPLKECRRGAHLPSSGREPLKSVTYGQCDAGPTVTFPATVHHCLLAGTKLYCLVTEARVCKKLGQGCFPKARLGQP